MTQERRPNRMKPKRLPDQDGDAWATTTAGSRVPSSKGQIQAGMIARKLDRHDLFLQTASTLACSVVWNAPLVHRQSIRLHSTPIDLAGGAV
jgi:hypothetical protein